MTAKRETFESLLNEFQYHFDQYAVFEDFLTLTICAFGQKPGIGKSYDEELYLQTIGKYKSHRLVNHFPKLLACLTMEMEERLGSSMGNDVLGDYYERNLSKKYKGQFFTPWPICQFMASILSVDTAKDVQRVLDPCCGSGRMLVCGANSMGKHHHFFGIDIDHTCVKMACLNLFLNGIFHAEVMWADALSPTDFRMSYRISLVPFGIFRISDPEQSHLWHAHKYSFPKKAPLPDIKLPSEEGNQDQGSQLHLF